jgi:hypothetical protein
VSADIRTCIDRLTPMPKPGPMSRREAAALIADLRASEVRKTRCGQRMIQSYDRLRKAI